ncbi:neutral zinc metallopeptidase [Desulfovibrio sp.]|uniref:KPN_02809 family neutral zinc metallopeptidase n=1 Tax=Desulfovibrio sp. TaxID=885 RepID=UPI0023C043D8|nr:neutral zinc metallopeptidase [Desulfovibrio sp.]MDE7242135.1 neutral zinc metallopeptidase [Desulfovibrio sp.]
MRWQNQQQSSHVEDRRGRSPMAFRGMPIGGKAGAILLLVVLVAGYYGYDLTPLLGGMGGDVAQVSSPRRAGTGSGDDELARFASVTLKSTEDTWDHIFRASGKRYDPPTLVLFSDSTETACGYGQSAMGPFYCPADRNVYIDLAFYGDMERKLGGGGDFALGYVLAHEVGHHVQNELGIAQEVRRQQSGASKAAANRLSVMLELQADCFAGVWGRYMEERGILESGDLEEALNTASAIGDDRLQRQSMGRVVPDSFTHGTSAQRLRWFRRGFDSGDPGQCNTFKGID